MCTGNDNPPGCMMLFLAYFPGVRCPDGKCEPKTSRRFSQAHLSQLLGFVYSNRDKTVRVWDRVGTQNQTKSRSVQVPHCMTHLRWMWNMQSKGSHWVCLSGPAINSEKRSSDNDLVTDLETKTLRVPAAFSTATVLLLWDLSSVLSVSCLLVVFFADDNSSSVKVV